MLGATLLAGRVSGLLREMQLASSLGVSSQADAAVLLLTLPDLLVNLLLSGGLSAALVPRLRALPTYRAQLLMRQTLISVLFLFSLLATFLVASPSTIFILLAPGLPSEAYPLTIATFMTAVAIPLAAASGVTAAGLNSQHKFLVAGCGTFIFNLAVIAALALGDQKFGQPLVMLSIGVTIGAALRLLSQLINLPKGWLIGPIAWTPIDTRLIRGFISSAVTASLMLLVPVIVRAFASTINPGAISAINYASKLVELPAGVLITSLASVALVRLSTAYSKKDFEEAQGILHRGLNSALTNAIGAGFLIAYFASAIVEIGLGRGAMDATAVERVAGLTQIQMIGLPFLAITSMNMADLNAREKPTVILKVTLLCLVLLPVLVLPGVLSGSELLLVWSIVGFQMLQSIVLSYRLGFKFTNLSQWFNLKCALILGCILLCIVSMDLGLRSKHIDSNYIRLFLASLGMSLIFVFQKRFIANHNSHV